MRPGNAPSGTFNTADGENTDLLNFAQERGFFPEGSRYGNAAQLHKRHPPLGRCRIKIGFNTRLPIFLENMRCVWRFETSQYEPLDLESHFQCYFVLTCVAKTL